MGVIKIPSFELCFDPNLIGDSLVKKSIFCEKFENNIFEKLRNLFSNSEIFR
jgi:hypothetical protein